MTRLGDLAAHFAGAGGGGATVAAVFDADTTGAGVGFSEVLHATITTLDKASAANRLVKRE